MVPFHALLHDFHNLQLLSCLAFGLRCLSFAVIQSNVILPEMTEAVRLIYLGAKTAGQSVLVTSDCASE